MEGDLKICNFWKYCKTCKHYSLCESEEPCDSCLCEPFNEGTEKPVSWEGRKRGRKKNSTGSDS